VGVSTRRGAISVNNLLTLTPANAANPDRQNGGDQAAGSIVVKTHNKGREVVGLEVGASNARRYFSKEASVVEFELDHLQIECRLAPDFWDGSAEIRDPRLCAWLAQKNFNGKVGESPLPMAMIPSGKNSFRLQPLPPLPVRSHLQSRHTPSKSPFNAA
jgi:hypothetical protein